MPNDWNAINNQRIGDYGVIRIHSNWQAVANDFQEMRDHFNANLRQNMAVALLVAEEVIVPILQKYTPVRTTNLGASPAPGELKRSTEAHTMISGDQYVMVAEQPAENAQGTEYGPFVILGHHTTSGGWVDPQKYPQAAWREIYPIAKALLAEAGRSTYRQTVRYLREKKR